MNTNLSAATHTVKHQHLAEGSAAPSKFVGKNVTKASVVNNIIQKKIRQLDKEGREYATRKYSDTFSIKEENKQKTTELEPSPAKRIRLHTDDEVNESISDISALLYSSKGEEQNLNCKFYRSNELVKCFQFSHWWLAKDRFEYSDIASKKLIEECHDIQNSSVLNKKFYCNGCPSEGIYFEINKFPKAIYNVATKINKGQEKRYLLCSYNHAMGLCIKKNKDNNIVIYYYDPNDTLRHLKIIAKTEYDLKNLKHNDFWSPENEQIYFPGCNKVACMLSLDTKALQKDCDVVCIDKPSAELLFILCLNGHYGHSAVSFNFKNLSIQKQFITKKSQKGDTSLFMACQYGHTESAKELLQVLYSTDLSSDEKEELLSGKRADCTPALFMACQEGLLGVVKELLYMIDSINLKPYAKKELLAGKDAYETPALFAACMEGHSEVVKALLEMISAIDLKPYAKKELFAGKEEDGVPALFMACKAGYSETVKVFLNAILSSPLNLTAKERLLTAKTEDGLSALQIAMNEKQMNTVKVFVRMVKNSHALCVSEKGRLLKPYNEHVLKNKSC